MFIDIVKYINIIYKFIMNMSKKMEFKQRFVLFFKKKYFVSIILCLYSFVHFVHVLFKFCINKYS